MRGNAGTVVVGVISFRYIRRKVASNVQMTKPNASAVLEVRREFGHVLNTRVSNDTVTISEHSLPLTKPTTRCCKAIRKKKRRLAVVAARAGLDRLARIVVEPMIVRVWLEL